MATQTKTCPNCAIEKQTTEFFRSKASKDGLQNYCRTCQAIRKRKPDESIGAAIRADQRCVDLIKSATKVSARKYVLPDGRRVNLHKEIAKLGYITSSPNFSSILAGIRGELTPHQKRRQNAANESEELKATKTLKPQKPLPNGSLDAINVEPESKYNKPDRYSIIRSTHRRTGQCSWGIWDATPYDNTNPVCYVADNLKAAILECNRLNQPPEKLRYTRRGQIGFVTNEDDEEVALESF